jgi:hypothetical protein
VTPIKNLEVGDTVLVAGYTRYGVRRIDALLTTIVGGVRLDQPIDGLRSWNEDELILVNKRDRT